MRDDRETLDAKITSPIMKRMNLYLKERFIMLIKEVEKRGDYTITHIYSVKHYLKEKGLKKTVKAIVGGK